MRGRVGALTVLLLAAACSGDSGSDSAATTTAPATTTTAAPEAEDARPVSPTPTGGCEGRPVAQPGTTDRTLRSGGVVRHFQLTVPESYDGTTPAPLLFALHALTVDYHAVPAISALTEPAEADGVVTVSPSGLLAGGLTPYWVAAPVEPNDDLNFLADLLDQLEDELCLDAGLVFSTGQSNGGQMSSLLACRMGDRITAVAPVAGVEFSDETCTGPPVPVMAFHGDADPIVPYDGGGLDAVAIADQNQWHGEVPPGLPHHRGVEAAMAEWAAHNGCGPEPEEERISPEVVRRSWPDCEAETVLYTIEGGGHTWPGHPVVGFEDQFGATTTDIDASELMFDFFLDD